MGWMTDEINAGVNVARAEQERRNARENRQQRIAEQMALQQYRNAQLINQARDDARAEKYAEAAAQDRAANIRRLSQADVDAASNREAIAQDRAANIRRLSQADVDAASNREAIAEDRGLAQKDRSDAAAEKLIEARKRARFNQAYQQAIAAPKTLEEMQALHPEGDMTQLGELPKQRTSMQAVNFAAGQPGIEIPQDVLKEQLTAEHMARAQREIPSEPIVMERNGSKFYLGANGWQPVPGSMGDKVNFHTEVTKEPGTGKTTRSLVPNAKPEVPATPEQTAALAEFYAQRSAAPAVVPVQPPMNSANNRQGNAPVVKARPAAKPKDDEKIEMISPSGKRGLVPKSQRDQALKQGYKLP